MPRKVIAGYWHDENVQKRLDAWMRAVIGVAVSKPLKIMGIGDNMREVAVTGGDKVEVQAKLGWQVNTWPVYLLRFCCLGAEALWPHNPEHRQDRQGPLLNHREREKREKTAARLCRTAVFDFAAVSSP